MGARKKGKDAERPENKDREVGASGKKRGRGFGAGVMVAAMAVTAAVLLAVLLAARGCVASRQPAAPGSIRPPEQSQAADSGGASGESGHHDGAGDSGLAGADVGTSSKAGDQTSAELSMPSGDGDSGDDSSASYAPGAEQVVSDLGGPSNTVLRRGDAATADARAQQQAASSLSSLMGAYASFDDASQLTPELGGVTQQALSYSPYQYALAGYGMRGCTVSDVRVYDSDDVRDPENVKKVSFYVTDADGSRVAAFDGYLNVKSGLIKISDYTAL